MTKHLRFLFVMLLAMIWSAGWAQTTIWSEDWGGVKKQQTPSAYNSAIYSQSNNNTQIYVSNKAYAGGELPELLLKEGANSTWTVKINDLKGCKGDVTLTLKTNKIGNLNVSVGSSTIKLATVEGQKNTYSGSFNVDGLAVPFNIVFLNTDKNLRLDDIVLTGTPTGETKTATTLSFDTEKKEFSVEKNSETSFTAPKAIVKNAAGEVVEGAKITYTSSNSNIASVDDNGIVTFGSEFGTATITASYDGDATHKPAESISYTITYSKIPTVMAWSQSSVSVNLGETFTAPTLTFTAHDVNILEGKTIKYNSSDENVAMIDETGIVLMDKAGSAKISATFAGDDTYEAASAEYTLNVIDPNKTDVTFDFTDPEKYGYSKPASGKSTDLSNGDKLESNGVTITSVQGGTSTETRFYNSNNAILLRVYTGAVLSVEAPAGYAINRIDFTDSGSSTVKNFTFSTGERNSKTWTGLAKNLTMTVDNNSVFLKNMTVNLVKLVELDENSESNTIEAKTGVNVTLNRPMNVGRWNTFCVPFSIDANQVTSQFGEGTQIAEYSVSVDNEIDFATVQSNAIVAGKAYLVKPTTEAATEGYTFSNVNITALAPTKEKVENGAIDFRGIYNPTDITEDLPTNTFAAGIVGNVVKKAVNGSNMKGFRAFFIIPEGVGAQSSYMLKIDGTATSINSINGADVVVNAPVYNLQGQRVDGNNLTPGIYVKAGKKFVVK